MDEKNGHIAVCPTCRSKYRIPPEYEGKKAVCKKCGTSFILPARSIPDQPPKRPPETDESPESTAAGREAEATPASGPVRISISEDHMSAFLDFPKGESSVCTADEVKQLLAENGIRHGIIPDEEIERYLQDLPKQERTLEIARGKKAVEGKDAAIKYFFDTDPLKIGTLKQGGVLDFRDRGDLPQIRKGALLAIREPPSPGKPGMDVLGGETRPPHPKDIKLRCGKGVVKSEDGLRAHATQDGLPMLSADGKLSVMPRLQIPKDVGLETGHVQFDGDVSVGGSIQDGFRVSGGRLSAGEILRADITVTGDIVVTGGIIGATIRGDGNLKARFIHDARIHVLGDVVVQKEIIDSDILSNGALLMETGKIFNSRISSKNGIVANQIGSDESKPCSLSIGIDDAARARIESLKAQKSRKKEKSRKLESISEKLRTISNEMHGEIAELAQIQDKGMAEQKELKADADRLKKEGSEIEASELLLRAKELDSEIRWAELRLAKRMDQQEKTLEKAEELKKRAQELVSECTAMKEDINEVYEWSQSDGGNPYVKVHGTIFSHTSIKGPHTTTELMSSFDQSMVTEKQVMRADGRREKWKLVAAPLK
jgi:uncharacterized protein (DUF342 family)